MREEKLPTYTTDLLKVMDTWYEDKFIDPESMSQIEYYKLAGKIELIRALKVMATR